MNFGEIQRVKLAKSTLLTSSLVPLGSLQVFLRSVQVMKRDWGAESNGKLPHLFIPRKTAILVPEFTVEHLLSDTTATSVFAFTVKDLPLGRKL